MQLNVNCQMISQEGYLIKKPKFLEFLIKGGLRGKRSGRGRKQRRRGEEQESRRGRRSGWRGQGGIGQCKLLSIVQNGASAC